MTAAAKHPLAAYDTLGLAITIAAFAGSIAAGHYYPTSVIALEFRSVMIGYLTVAILLWPGRRISGPEGVALYAALVTLIGTLFALIASALTYVNSPHVVPGPAPALLAATAILLGTVPDIARRWFNWRAQRALEAQAAKHAAERAMLEATLTALQGQIEPHFLFNTLANVQYLLQRDTGRANTMLEHLIAYLRSTLPEMRQLRTPLAQELARVRAYLDIMQIRMGDRLRYDIACPDDLARVPVLPLCLATLVENALKHGLENKPGGGTVAISVWRDDTGPRPSLVIAIDDDGVGFSETGDGSGVGLRNLRERLQALYGDAASLTLVARDTGGVRASLAFPIETGEQAL